MFRKSIAMMLASAVLSALFVMPVNVSAHTDNREDHNRADTVTMYGYTSDYAITTEDGVMHEVDYDNDSYYTHKCVKCEVEKDTGDIISFEYVCVLSAEKKLAQAGYKRNIKTIFSEPADYEWGTEKDDWLCVKAYDKTGENVLAEVLIEDGIVGSVVEY